MIDPESTYARRSPEEVEADMRRPFLVVSAALQVNDFMGTYTVVADPENGRRATNPDNPITPEIARHILPHMELVLDSPFFNVTDSLRDLSLTDIGQFRPLVEGLAEIDRP